MLNPLSAMKLSGQALWPLWLGDNKPIYRGLSGDVTHLRGDKGREFPAKPLFLANQISSQTAEEKSFLSVNLWRWLSCKFACVESDADIQSVVCIVVSSFKEEMSG